MNETTKAAARRAPQPLFQRAFTGHGIDVGCGPDVLKTEHGFTNILSCQPFDKEHGDANRLSDYFPENHFDFLHASQVLEHMEHPYRALINWIRVVKPGGYVVFSVPDVTLYEGRVFPSTWNPDHKTTWSIGPDPWSIRSTHVVLARLLLNLPQLRPLRIDLVDTNYDYELAARQRVDQTLGNAEAFIEVVARKV